MFPAVPAFVPADGVVEVAITIAVMVIAFIGWIVQIAGQVKGPQAGPANRPRPAAPRPAAAPNRPQQPRDERLQSEIDAFLREVSTGRKPEPVEEDAIEVIDDEPDEPPRRVAQVAPAAASGAGRAPSSTGRASEWDREQQRRRERMVSTLGDRHLDSTPLGTDLRKHVEQYMNESVRLRQEKEQVERRLAETRAELQAMRSQTAASPAAAPVMPAVSGGPRGNSRFSALLKNRRSVKDAIVINEVLGRPKGMTRRR